MSNEDKIYVSEGLLLKEIEWPINWSEHIRVADMAPLSVCVRCAICEESTPMTANDVRAQSTVFICEKCKAAILHIRNLLETGGSVV